MMMINSFNLLLASVLSSANAVAPAVTFLSFEAENTDQAVFERAAGSFISEINPLTNDSVNPTTHIGRYIRNPAIVWDWSLFSTSAISDASLYLDGQLTFQMDVLTYDAEIGTQIDITIEDSAITATQDYPLGRHSRYTAVTSVQGAWETLIFTKLDQPDADVANDAISGILISYAPGQSVGGTFYVDNLVGVAVAVTASPNTSPPTAAPSPLGAILWDDFTANLFDSQVWQTRLPLSRSAATTGVYIDEAIDDHGATLLYPANRPEGEWGPAYSTQIKSAEMNLYGNYEARLKSGRANEGEGVISAFFTYFNDEVDYDGDGIHDNHEIDFELLNSDRSSIWCSVYTDYQYLNDVCTFHRNSARINVATGEVWATVPGNEGNWDLVQVDNLDWSMPGFDHSASFYTYGFEWSESKVTFWIDLEDGIGRRQLFEVLSDGSGGPNDHIPNMPAATFFNIWHTYVDWFSRADAPPMSVDTVMEIDYVRVMPVSTTSREPTKQPTTPQPTPQPSNVVTTAPTKIPTPQPTFSPTPFPITPSPTTTNNPAPAVNFLSFEAENSDQAVFERAAGSFLFGDDEINPLTNDSVNPTTHIGRYIRNPAIVWDWSLFSTSAINDASLYLDGQLTFHMDVLTYDADIGTRIDITIEDTAITATQDYPLGRHSRYTAVTSVQGAWETLIFTKLDQPDADVANDAISAILISYAPGQSVAGTFYVDNLVGVAVAATASPSTSPPTAAPSPLVVTPAPTENPTALPTQAPTPTSSPSKAPITPSPTKAPIVQTSPPSAPPSASPTTSQALTKTLVCGRGDIPDKPCTEGLESIANIDTMHEVRCCRDCEGLDCSKPWKRKCTEFDSNLFARTKYAGECKIGTFAEAIDFCRNIPGENTRLCTPDELKNSCAKGTGCNFDKELVWSCSYDGHVCSTDAECCGTCGVNGVCVGESNLFP